MKLIKIRNQWELRSDDDVYSMWLDFEELCELSDKIEEVKELESQKQIKNLIED